MVVSDLGVAFDAHYRKRAEEAGVPYDPPAEPARVEPTAPGGLQYALGHAIRERATRTTREEG